MGAINQGDTAWILISTALVLMMTPALAFFYGGMVRRKNILSALNLSFVLRPLSVSSGCFSAIPWPSARTWEACWAASSTSGSLGWEAYLTPTTLRPSRISPTPATR